MNFSAKPLPIGKNSFYLTRSLLLCSPSRPTISCSSCSVPKLSVLAPAPALDCGSFYCVLVKVGCTRRFFLSVKKRTAACCKHATVFWVSRMVRHHDHLRGSPPWRKRSRLRQPREKIHPLSLPKRIVLGPPSHVPHVRRIQTHRSRARYRHGFERALDYCFGVV